MVAPSRRTSVKVNTVLVWMLILVVAVVNGGFRDKVLVPLVGEAAGRAVSSVLLSAMILAVTWVAFHWLRPSSLAVAWGIGLGWLGLTLAFEFLAGHYLFGRPWEDLLLDYDVRRGRIWVLVLVTTVAAPAAVYRARAATRHAADAGGLC
jgi:hypothetical protein